LVHRGELMLCRLAVTLGIRQKRFAVARKRLALLVNGRDLLLVIGLRRGELMLERFDFLSRGRFGFFFLAEQGIALMRKGGDLLEMAVGQRLELDVKMRPSDFELRVPVAAAAG